MTRAYNCVDADGHILEPLDLWDKYIDPKFRDRAPRIQRTDAGDLFWIDGMKTPVPLGIVAAAGKPAEEIRMMGTRFEDLHRGGWDPDARLEDQARDGVAAEIIYPTVGMQICNHKDLDYKRACFEAYNRWIGEYCAAHPERLLGAGQTAMRTPARTTGNARGSSTQSNRCRSVMPRPVAASTTAGSTERMPACVFCRMGRIP